MSDVKVLVRTLQRRAEIVTSEKKDLQSERQHVNKALSVCKYPKWVIRKVVKNLSKGKDKIKKAVSGKKE